MNVRSFIICLLFGLLIILPVARCGNQDDFDQFRQTCANLAQNAQKSNTITVAGKDNWLFLAPELRHLGAGQFWGKMAASVTRAAKPEIADPLPAILDFNDQLKKLGVELIVVPVPPKAVIYPEMLPAFTRLRQDSTSVVQPSQSGALLRRSRPKTTPSLPDLGQGYAAVPLGFTNQNETARLDRTLQEFYTLLRSKGVKVLDLTDFFMQNKSHPQGILYCRQDSHWSGNGCVLAAKKIAADVHLILGSSGRQTNNYQSDWQTIEINGDLRQALKNTEIPREKLSIRKISKADADEPIEPGAESKVILLGDSHNLIFHAGDDMLSSNAGLPDQLAFELGEEVELVAARGSGATPARINLMRRAQQRKDYWKNKKCVIWCFSAREFTESDGWRKVPISPSN